MYLCLTTETEDAVMKIEVQRQPYKTSARTALNRSDMKHCGATRMRQTMFKAVDFHCFQQYLSPWLPAHKLQEREMHVEHAIVKYSSVEVRCWDFRENLESSNGFNNRTAKFTAIRSILMLPAALTNFLHRFRTSNNDNNCTVRYFHRLEEGNTLV